MNSLQDYSMSSLLPESLKKDQFIIALGEAVEKELKEAYREAETLSNIYDVDNLPELLLDYLAYQKHVDFYENSLPIETKRKLISESTHSHITKGTPAAVEKALDSVLGDVSLTEWFEYGGNPYHFKVDINILNTGISQETINLVEKMIEAYKNKRSIIEKINLFLTNRSKQYFTVVTHYGEETSVYPWRQTEIETKVNYTFGVASQLAETTFIYPQ